MFEIMLTWPLNHADAQQISGNGFIGEHVLYSIIPNLLSFYSLGWVHVRETSYRYIPL